MTCLLFSLVFFFGGPVKRLFSGGLVLPFLIYYYYYYVYSCWRHPRAPGSFVGFSGVQGSGV